MRQSRTSAPERAAADLAPPYELNGPCHFPLRVSPPPWTPPPWLHIEHSPR